MPYGRRRPGIGTTLNFGPGMRTPFGARTVLSNTRGLSSNGTSGFRSCCVACWATVAAVHVNTTSSTHDPVRVILAALSREWR